jgi:hypothetical protein
MYLLLPFHACIFPLGFNLEPFFPLVSTIESFVCLVPILEYNPLFDFSMGFGLFHFNIVGCLLFGFSSVQYEGYCPYCWVVA